MGQCYGKTSPAADHEPDVPTTTITVSAAVAGGGEAAGAAAAAMATTNRPQTPARGSGVSAGSVKNTPARSSNPSPWPSPYPHGVVSPSPARASTPGRFFKRRFAPPSPAKHIKASLARRLGHGKPKEGPIPEEGGVEAEQSLDKTFGYSRNLGSKYELGAEVGRGHFGHTCSAKVKKGDLKDHSVAVKIISKAKMTTAIAIEDVRREAKILKALSGHKHLVKFYDAYEDGNNVYIVMELCEGGELLDRILARGGKYPEEDAKVIVGQILSVVAFCHLQGVVHRDLKPENFLFTSKSEEADMKLIDFGLSDFIRPDARLNDIVGSAYYVAPEVLHRSYSLEADIWSIGVITYILLCGSRPFWARTESGIFRAVLRADPNFEDLPWPSVSQEAKDFVKRLLNKDYRKRMSAVQALTHPWLRNDNRPVPLDIFVYKLVKAYFYATPLKRAALKALSKALTEDELIYLRAQFKLLEPDAEGRISLYNFKMALQQNATEAMKESRVFDVLNAVKLLLLYGYGDVHAGFDLPSSPSFLLESKFKIGSTMRVLSAEDQIANLMEPLAFRKMDFEEFCAAAISTHQLEAIERWEQIASTGFQHFEQEGNRVISVEELARDLNLGPSAYSVLRDWIRNSDGKLSLLGYTKYLHGVTLRSPNTRHH